MVLVRIGYRQFKKCPCGYVTKLKGQSATSDWMRHMKDCEIGFKAAGGFLNEEGERRWRPSREREVPWQTGHLADVLRA